jgi:hypothetical protein
MEFDHAILIRALHHASIPAALVRAARNLMKPGGTLYAVDFWAESLEGTIRKFFRDPGLPKRYAERLPPGIDELSGAVEAGIATMNDWAGDYYRCLAVGFYSVADVTGFWGRLSAGPAAVTLCDEGRQYVAEWTKS